MQLKADIRVKRINDKWYFIVQDVIDFLAGKTKIALADLKLGDKLILFEFAEKGGKVESYGCIEIGELDSVTECIFKAIKDSGSTEEITEYEQNLLKLINMKPLKKG